MEHISLYFFDSALASRRHRCGSDSFSSVLFEIRPTAQQRRGTRAELTYNQQRHAILWPRLSSLRRHLASSLSVSLRALRVHVKLRLVFLLIAHRCLVLDCLPLCAYIYFYSSGWQFVCV